MCGWVCVCLGECVGVCVGGYVRVFLCICDKFRDNLITYMFLIYVIVSMGVLRCL